MSFAKFCGWVLLLAGLAALIYSLYSSYTVFTGKKAAPEIFKVKEIESPASESAGQGIQAQMEEMIKEQMQGLLGQMLPVDSIPTLLNLLSWSIFAGILILGGGKIAGLGIRLLK